LQVGSHRGQHAMAAPGDLWRQFMTSSQKLPEQLLAGQELHRLSHHLSGMPKAAGALLTRTGLWLLEGLQSAGELAGLTLEPAGQEMDMPSLPGLCCCQPATLVASQKQMDHSHSLSDRIWSSNSDGIQCDPWIGSGNLQWYDIH